MDQPPSDRIVSIFLFLNCRGQSLDPAAELGGTLRFSRYDPFVGNWLAVVASSTKGCGHSQSSTPTLPAFSPYPRQIGDM